MFFRNRKKTRIEPTDDEIFVPEHTIQSEPSTIKLVEEEVVLGKDKVVGDTVRVSTVTDVETFPLTETLRRENYDVERVVREQVVETIPEIRKEDGVMIIPVLEERLVVTKQLVLREEIHLKPKHSVETYEDTVELRKQRAIIERIAAE